MVQPIDFQKYLTSRTSDQPVGTTLKDGGGDGTSGGMEDWKSSVDRQLTQLHGDVCHLLYGLVGAALLTLGAIGGLYIRGDASEDTLERQITDVRVGQATANSKMDVLLERTKER